jgi:predicted transcriptional regulator
LKFGIIFSWSARHSEAGLLRSRKEETAGGERLRDGESSLPVFPVQILLKNSRRNVILYGEMIRLIRRFTMLTAKEKMNEIIKNQPEDSTYEEILKELAFARMVERGLEDSKAGRSISNEEMSHRIRSWHK